MLNEGVTYAEIELNVLKGGNQNESHLRIRFWLLQNHISASHSILKPWKISYMAENMVQYRTNR